MRLRWVRYDGVASLIRRRSLLHHDSSGIASRSALRRRKSGASGGGGADTEETGGDATDGYQQPQHDHDDPDCSQGFGRAAEVDGTLADCVVRVAVDVTVVDVG